MVFDHGSADAVTVLLVQLEQEILGSNGGVLRVVIDIAEGRVEENFHKASKLFLADTLWRHYFAHRLEQVLFHGGRVLEVINEAQIGEGHCMLHKQINGLRHYFWVRLVARFREFPEDVDATV